MDVAKYMLISSIQHHTAISGNSMVWTLLSVVLMYLFNYVNDHPDILSPTNLRLKWLKTQRLFHTRYTYTVEGKCWNTFNPDFQTQKILNSMSPTYVAMIQYLTLEFEGRDQFRSIYNLNTYKKTRGSMLYDEEITEINVTEPEQIIPNQSTPVCIHPELDIHCSIYFKRYEEETVSNKHSKNSTSVDIYKITVELFSYTSSSFVIKAFVDGITTKYLDTVESSRRNKRFVYTMLSVRGNTDDDDDVMENDITRNGIVWNEMPFETVKTFDTVCLKHKQTVLGKINFFLNNRDWYYQHGIPYTLGIGLHGPPGTGKTSFIKALARHTNRHIVCISMKVVTTRNQLQSVFYETKYNRQNAYVGFKDKIIVFEDIDCTGKIVMERDVADSADASDDGLECEDSVVAGQAEAHPANALAKSLNKLMTTTPTGAPIQKDKALTLDDLLNVWDGIRETPGRIIVVTSNFYHKLDKALVRPGRIDLEIETTMDDAMAFSSMAHGISAPKAPCGGEAPDAGTTDYSYSYFS